MKQKGSITVFLSLILILVFSFVLTALEAARIRGATAYVSMLSELAGDSFLASYYYPLFQEYRLFGVDAGDETGFFQERLLEAELQENLLYGAEGFAGGLLKFQNTTLFVSGYETMLSAGEAEFFAQVRNQTALDGLSLALKELFSKELFTEAGVVGEVYRKQEEALAETATVTEELLQLMKLVDGIRMGKQGIVFDKNGRIQTEKSFIKQLVLMDQAEVKATYENDELFRAVSGEFYRADRAAERISRLISEVEDFDADISSLEYQISGLQNRLSSLKEQRREEWQRLQKEESKEDAKLAQLDKDMEETAEALMEAEATKEDYESWRNNTVSEAKEEYRELQRNLDAVESLVEDALDVMDKLERKQKAARIAVIAYEQFLTSKKQVLSDGLYQVFYKELETMKAYAGLEEQGYVTEVMRQSLEANQKLLQEIRPDGFSEWELFRMDSEMNKILFRMKEYTVEGLWFSYGEIKVAEKTGEILTGALAELLTTGILGLVGISEEDLSDRSLNREALPSAGLKTEGIVGDLMSCISEVEQLLQNGSIGEALKIAGNAALDGTVLELYARKYFHSFGEEAPYTKLNYEREYIVFGAEEDKTNLLYTVLYLVAIRTLFSMVMILKQPDRMASLDAISAGVAGFTGAPVLAAVVKYSLLLLWSVEEALIEVSALLQGKRVAVIGMGTVTFGEIFLCGKSMIASKAQSVPDGAGAEYEDYLTLLSMMKGTQRKAYRIMDLIQENIRYRYRDSFRVRNLVTAISFSTSTELKKQFDTGVFPGSAYHLEKKTECTY